MPEISVGDILQFLFSNGYCKAFLALEQQSSQRMVSFGKELDFLYTLVVEGKFRAAQKFILPVKQRDQSGHRSAVFLLRRQRFLESFATADQLNDLVALIKEVQAVASDQEFASLCMCLKLSKLTDHPDFADWDIPRGRIQCFYDCLQKMTSVFSVDGVTLPNLKHKSLVAQSTVIPHKPVLDTRASMRFAPRQEARSFHPSQLVELASISAHNPIRACSFSGSGDYFALGTNSKSIKICSLYTSQRLNVGVIVEMMNMHLGSVYCVDWSPSGKLLASGSNDKTIKITEIPDLSGIRNTTVLYDNGAFLNADIPRIQESCIRTHRGTVRALCFLNDGLLASGGIVDPEVKVFDSLTSELVLEMSGHTGEIHGISGFQDTLASVGSDKHVRLWDVRSGRQTLSFETADAMNSVCVNWKQAGDKLSAGHCDGSISVWDLKAGKLASRLLVHSAECRSVDFSANGEWLLSGSFDKSLGIVSMRDSVIYKLEPHSDKIVSARWHPAKPMVLSTSADKTARIFAPEEFNK